MNLSLPLNHLGFDQVDNGGIANEFLEIPRTSTRYALYYYSMSTGVPGDTVGEHLSRYPWPLLDTEEEALAILTDRFNQGLRLCIVKEITTRTIVAVKQPKPHAR